MLCCVSHRNVKFVVSTKCNSASRVVSLYCRDLVEQDTHLRAFTVGFCKSYKPVKDLTGVGVHVCVILVDVTVLFKLWVQRNAKESLLPANIDVRNEGKWLRKYDVILHYPNVACILFREE